MTRRLHLTAAALASAAVLILSVLGCDDDTTTTQTGTITGTTTGTGSGTGGGTGGTGGGTGGTATGVGGSAPDGVGTVMGTSGTYLATPESVVTAMFFAEPIGPSADCSDTTDGDCTITTCNYGGGGGSGGTGGAGGAGVSPNAGVITVTGGVRDVTLTPEADGTYTADASNTELLFNGGETLTIAAAGADIAQFSEQLTAPSLVTVTAPDFTGGVTIPTSTDLTVTWTGGTDGNVTATLTGANASTGVSVVCTYAATAGTGTVPATALDDLLPFGTGAISIFNTETITITPSNWLVSLMLTSAGASASSATGRAIGQTTYQ